MMGKKYQELLLKRIESTFAMWEEQDTIEEQELYKLIKNKPD